MVVGAVAACGPSHRVNPSLTPDGDRVITSEQIATMQVSTAWDVIERSGVVDMSEAVDGRSAEIHSRLGTNSITLTSADEPMLIVDGVRFTDPRVLQNISALSIERLRIMGAIQGTIKEGTNATAGVIEITTKTSPNE
ncbi:MAG TPA: TonB-dependent receptor plug domain-containing protein [Vicinamibacterales bacterium]|nr:TonB-dependent receptor plug domain-containing protein [Vicinamibacterales bacterium]